MYIWQIEIPLSVAVNAGIIQCYAVKKKRMPMSLFFVHFRTLPHEETAAKHAPCLQYFPKHLCLIGRF